YYEIFKILKKAGFRKLTVPSNSGKGNLPLPLLIVKSFLMAEKCLAIFKSIKLRKKIYRRLARIFNIPSELVVIAEK
ncbi:MAG: hypothetical protein JWR09_954, partial [Mucilaginibacter sp.]|nr:hypothetical protein [Mucilaginibacter sp.]